MLLGCQVAVKKKAPQSVGSHGPGVGLGFLPRLPPPSCARPVSGVGLGPGYYPASLLWSPGPRPSPDFRSAVCDCLSLNVSIVVLQLLHEPKLIFASVCASFTTQILPISPPRCRDLQVEDFVALGRLAAEQLENKTRIASAGGVEALVKAIQTHARNEAIQKYGCRALAMCRECSR